MMSLLEKIRRIHITTTRLATNTFAGEYKSVFKGRGLEFHEVREYTVGDEIRQIDWNVTARAGRPFIKKFVEERELTIMILLDASRSNYFGSVNTIKKELAAEVASVFAASANKNNDKVGLIIFTDRIEKYIPPRKGHRHMQRIIREALCLEPVGTGTDIPMALRFLDEVTTRSTISFLVSDFYVKDIKKSATIANKRHDIVAVRILDPLDLALPDAGMITICEAETGRTRILDTSMRELRDEYKRKADERIKALDSVFRSVSIDMIDINTSKDYTQALEKFFNTRKQRRRTRA